MDFFNPTIREKRQKPLFSQQGCLKKILHFIIQNNLSFRVINSKSFQELLYYYNRYLLLFFYYLIFKKYTNYPIANHLLLIGGILKAF